MASWIDRSVRARLGYRVAASGLVGYPLIHSWRKGWLPTPNGGAIALLGDRRRLSCLLSDEAQRTMYLGLFEPGTSQLVRELLSPGDTFVDIGAHIGWYSTIASTWVANGKVVAFEPFTSNARSLKENLALNDCENVRVVELALGSESGTLLLTKANNDSGGVTALEWVSTAEMPHLEVSVMTLDEAAPDLGPIALIKIDVEGWEAHVLRGAEKTLSATQNVIIEINRGTLKKAGSSQEEIFDLLRDAGFTCFLHVVEGSLRQFLPGGGVSNVLATRATNQPGSVPWQALGLSQRAARYLKADAGGVLAPR